MTGTKVVMSNPKKEVESDLSSKGSNIDYSLVYKRLLSEYKSSQLPVEVDFRKLVDMSSRAERFTHLLHTYPAKLLVNIPYFFINCKNIINDNSTILDPFCGSGTVLLESIIAGHDAIGADANPLARLISKSKTTPIDSELLQTALDKVLSLAEYSKDMIQPNSAMLDWSRWYSEPVKRKLGKLAYAIEKQTNSELKEFLNVCLSQTARKVSFADPTVSVPVRLNPERFSNDKKKSDLIREQLKSLSQADVEAVFQKITLTNIKRMSKLHKNPYKGKVTQLLEDAKFLDGLLSNSVDLIITSPPYAGAQKYIRSSSLSIGWLNLSPDGTLRCLEKKNIGREHYSKSEYTVLPKLPIDSITNLIDEIKKKNPLRAHIVVQYLIEMRQAINECFRVLKSKGTMVLVVGNNVICGHEFETQKYLRQIAEEIGFTTEMILRDEIHSRGLMTKRNKTASLIACEWIIILKKV